MGMTRIKESPTRKHIMDYIAVYWASNGFAPALRDISAGIGMSSTNVHYHLTVLKEEGKINYLDGKARTITIVEELDADTDQGRKGQ